jgi:hypothetical protein
VISPITFQIGLTYFSKLRCSLLHLSNSPFYQRRRCSACIRLGATSVKKDAPGAAAQNLELNINMPVTQKQLAVFFIRTF